jgi:P4 family phage/plasmid primase-like protien
MTETAVTLIERIDLKKLRCIVKNIDELQDKIGRCTDMKTYGKIDYDGTKTILKKYLASKDNNGSSKIKYDFSSKSKDGRLFSKTPSLQGLPRMVRHTIAGGNMIDIDIKNCHPEIFKWYCKNNGIVCDNLCYYIDNRDNCLSDLTNTFQDLSRDNAKTSVLSIINGGSGCIDIESSPDWYYNLAIEVSNAHEIIAKNFPNYVSAIKRTKGEDAFNINGKVCNKMFCYYEGIILNHMIDFAKSCGLQVGVLAFDGLMVYKKDGINLDEILLNMEKYVFDKVGIQLKIVEKEMNEGIDLTKFNYDMEIPYIPDNDEDIGIYIVKKIIEDGNIYYSEKMGITYIYNSTTKLFEESKFERIITCISGYILPLIDTELLIMDDGCDNEKKWMERVKILHKLKSNLKSTMTQKQILTQIKNRLPSSDDFIEKNFNAIPHLFPIGGDVIDFRTLEVVPRTKEHYFTYTTNNVYKPDRPNKHIINNYIGEILKTENEAFKTCLLTYLGYCLTNENCVKAFCLFSGDGDNGKSVFFNLFKSIIGNQFSCVANNKVFLEAKSSSVHSDEYLRLVGKRLAYIQEVTENSMFNEQLIKSVTGNDGEMSFRACGGKTVEVLIKCKLLGILNDDQMPTFRDKQGFSNRLKIFPFNNKFKKDAKKGKEIESWKDDFFTELCWYVKNHFYDNEMNIEFSEEVEMATNEVKNDMDSIKTFFQDKVEITGDDGDRVPRPKLFTTYQGFCIENGLQSIMVGRKGFNNYIADNFKLEVLRDREWMGIRLVKDDFEVLSGCPL